MIDLEIIRNYCLAKPEVIESFPFDEDSPVYKVNTKIFLILNINIPLSINLKCDPEYSIEFREKYYAITPGYHMNKKHWITITLDGSMPTN